MNRRFSSNWLRLALLKSLLIFTVSAGADVNHFDRRGDNDGGNAEGGIGGGPRDGGGRGDQGGGNNGGGRGGNGGNNGGGRGDNDGGWGDERDSRGGRGGGGRGDNDGRDGRGGRGGNGGGRGDHGGNRPDPNPYDPNPGHPGRDPRYPDSPCQRDPRRCPPGPGGGWQTERTVYVNQVFQQQYVDLHWLANGVLNNMYGYGLVGVEIEVLNQWGPSTLRLIVNNQQIDAQNVFNRYVSLRAYQPIDLNHRNQLFLGVQGRVHIGSVTLHFQQLNRR